LSGLEEPSEVVGSCGAAVSKKIGLGLIARLEGWRERPAFVQHFFCKFAFCWFYVAGPSVARAPNRRPL
jgi:hypothetical protein